MRQFHLTKENLMTEIILEDKQTKSYSLLSVWEMVVPPERKKIIYISFEQSVRAKCGWPVAR